MNKKMTDRSRPTSKETIGEREKDFFSENQIYFKSLFNMNNLFIKNLKKKTFLYSNLKK
jgi:hypothetical protein